MHFLGFVANIVGSETNISINVQVRGKPDGHLQGALTICMENPEIPGRIQMERFIPVEIFRKKSNTLGRYYLFPVFTETTEIFCTICLDYQCREKMKNLPVFCKWYNSIPFLFSVPKIIPIPFNGHFSLIFSYKW